MAGGAYGRRNNLRAIVALGQHSHKGRALRNEPAADEALDLDVLVRLPRREQVAQRVLVAFARGAMECFELRAVKGEKNELRHPQC